MNLELFKLKELPFRLNPDPQFLYLSKAHARAKAYMESTIWFTDGFVVITGEIGSGKTTLIETFVSELDSNVTLAQISQTQVTAVEFLQSVLVQFGIKPFQMKKAELLATLNNFLVEQYEAGRKVLLIVDEAQNLGLRVLEEIRMLSGIDNSKEKILRIILAGQPELNAKLDAPELVQLVQRVRLRFHLTALNHDDTRAYILHRLEVAGSQGREIFLPETYDPIYRYTGGVPRLINTLCDTAMLAAANDDRDQVSAGDVKAAVGELQWVEFGQRPSTGRVAATARATARAIRQIDRVPQPVAGAPLARLLVMSHGKTVCERALSVGRIIIGRASDADLHVDSPVISRHHCQIVTSEKLCVLEDLNSSNGVYIKNQRVRRHNLNDGDVVSLGAHQILYVDERPGTRLGADAEAPDTGSHPRLAPAGGASG
ncbi:MAG TPA: AAA family ATPase [Steroidobacteraceae bacterium]|nr:AAA family ATPase [Steroidobacteraceae bacterium]